LTLLRNSVNLDKNEEKSTMEKNKILIVDDIAMNRFLLSEIIEQAGYEYSMAKNGREAIQKIQAGDFNIVLMDIEMPVMNGFETTRHIKNKLPEPFCKIPVIAITAHDPASFFEEYEGVGFESLISKPYTLEKIEKAIGALRN
jgi:CheY-like chemotaxis protein